MSCPQEPTTDDVEYKCFGKGTGGKGYCIYYFWVPKDKTTGNEDRCETCVTVEGVISALRTLVFREPWWATEGKAGEPKKEAWELDGLEKKVVDEDDNDDDDEAAFGDGMTTKERMNFRRKMEQQFLSTQGSGLTEDEMLAGCVSRNTFDSPSSTLVGEEWGERKDDGKTKEVENLAEELQTLGEESV